MSTATPYSQRWSCFRQEVQVVLAFAYLRGTNRSAYIRHSDMAERVHTKQNLGKGVVPPTGEEGRRNERWSLPSPSIGFRVERDRDSSPRYTKAGLSLSAGAGGRHLSRNANN